MLQYNPSISGSLSVTGSLIVTNGMIGTVSGVDVQIFSSSINQVITGIQAATGSQEGRLGSIESFTSSTSARLGSIETISASNLSRIGSLETISASNVARISSLETTSASVGTLNNTQNARLSALETTSASVDTLNTNQNTRLTNLEIKTGSLATTGSNTFIGTQTITGSLFISANLIVQGTSSLENITASAVSIGTNIVNLNTANPAVRYAGLVIGDSGSIGSSGSFLYDSVQDEFIFVHRGANTTVTSSVVLMGPQTYDNIGNETYLTNNRIPKGAGNEHLTDSNISDDGTTVTLISRALSGTSATFSNNVTAVQGVFRNSGVPAIQAFRDLDVVSVGSAGQGIEFGARSGANYIAGASIYGGLDNPATTGNLVFQTLTAGTLTTKLTIASNGAATFSSSVAASGRITAGGTMLLGEVQSSYSLLETTSGNGIWLRPAGVSSPNGVFINTLGAVGIRTSSPQASLHIAGQSNTNGLTIGASNAYEIFITGSDSANIYHASPNQDIYLNTNGGKLYFGTSAASTLLTISGENVGIGISSPSQKLNIDGLRGQPATTGTTQNGLFRLGTLGSGYGEVLDIGVHVGVSGPTSYSWIQSTNQGNLGVNYSLALNPNGGNVGIGTNSPANLLSINGVSTQNSGLVNINNTYSAGGLMHSALLVTNTRGNHSYGTVAEFRITNTTDTDRPSILFSKGGTNNNWSLGMGVFAGNVDSFSVGYRSSYYLDAWATPYLTVTTGGRVGIGITNPSASLHITAPFSLNSEAFRLGWSGVGGLIGTLTSTTGQPYVNYGFYNGNVTIGTGTAVGRLHTVGGICISNAAETYRRALLNFGQSGTFSQVKVFFNKNNWGSVTYDIKLASAGGTYHTAGCYYSNPGFSSNLVSINAGNGPTMSMVADSQTGSTQGAIWTFSGATMIHPMVTIDIACGNGYQIDPNDVVVQFS